MSTLTVGFIGLGIHGKAFLVNDLRIWRRFYFIFTIITRF